MVLLQQYAATLGLELANATHAIEAYALGVVLGGPAVTILAARLNRCHLLLALMALFGLGHVLSAVAGSLGRFALTRFLSGIPQGAYFGAGALVASYLVGPGQGGRAFALVMTGLTVATIVGSPLATWMGQAVGWRDAYLAVSALGVLSNLAVGGRRDPCRSEKRPLPRRTDGPARGGPPPHRQPGRLAARQPAVARRTNASTVPSWQKPSASDRGVCSGGKAANRRCTSR